VRLQSHKENRPCATKVAPTAGSKAGLRIHPASTLKHMVIKTRFKDACFTLIRDEPARIAFKKWTLLKIIPCFEIVLLYKIRHAKKSGGLCLQNNDIRKRDQRQFRFSPKPKR
jgi:hypothetical protein